MNKSLPSLLKFGPTIILSRSWNFSKIRYSILWTKKYEMWCFIFWTQIENTLLASISEMSLNWHIRKIYDIPVMRGRFCRCYRMVQTQEKWVMKCSRRTTTWKTDCEDFSQASHQGGEIQGSKLPGKKEEETWELKQPVNMGTSPHPQLMHAKFLAAWVCNISHRKRYSSLKEIGYNFGKNQDSHYGGYSTRWSRLQAPKKPWHYGMYVQLTHVVWRQFVSTSFWNMNKQLNITRQKSGKSCNMKTRI